MSERAIEQVVENHTVQLSFIVGAISEIKEAIKDIVKTNADIKVIMERQANHEESNLIEHKRLHERLDKVEKDIEDIVETHKLKCEIVEPKVAKGETAYKVLAWSGAIGGASMIAHFMAQVFKIGGH